MTPAWNCGARTCVYRERVVVSSHSYFQVINEVNVEKSHFQNLKYADQRIEKELLNQVQMKGQMALIIIGVGKE